MREITDEQRDRMIGLVYQKQWVEGDIGNPEHQGRSETIADRIIADGWRLLPTRSELESLEWTTFIAGDVNDEIYHHLDSSGIDYMIAAGFAREDPDGN